MSQRKRKFTDARAELAYQRAPLDRSVCSCSYSSRMDFELAGDDPAFDQPSPSTTAAPSPAPHAAAQPLANGTTTRRRKGLPVHRCRFPDWNPASVTALAITPESFDAGLLGLGGCSGERGVLAVGRANGDVELMVWGGQQGWISWRVRWTSRTVALSVQS